MTLTDTQSYRQIIGCLMHNPLLFLEFPDIQLYDFDIEVPKICLMAIKRLYDAGAKELSVLEVDQEVMRGSAGVVSSYTNNGGLEFLKTCYEYAQLSNFETYYKRLKKYSLLRALKAAHYDISKYYLDDKDIKDPAIENELIRRIDEAKLEDILNDVEKDYSEIRNKYLNGDQTNNDPAEGLNQLLESLRTSPNVGVSLEGEIFNTACRGARKGCFYLKSSSTSGGKSRTSVFDACHIAYPKRWSHEKQCFVEKRDSSGKIMEPRKVLFIVTEMDKEELQTIMLAYLSGVDEDHILRNAYELGSGTCPGEYTRVQYAAKIIEEYSGYFLIETISDPNLQNVEALIKRYVIINNVEYIFFDYIHSTPSMINQFSKNNIREDVVLMMMANQLKQIAHDYNVFIFSATQVNSLAMGDDEMAFKDEKSIRGSKAIADKADVGYVMTKVTEKGWNSVKPALEQAVRNGTLDPSVLDERPSHVLDIYKMRRGRYKMVRIWTYLHLGTGRRHDIFMTTASNGPLGESFKILYNIDEEPISISTKEEEEHDSIATGS